MQPFSKLKDDTCLARHKVKTEYLILLGKDQVRLLHTSWISHNIFGIGSHEIEVHGDEDELFY